MSGSNQPKAATPEVGSAAVAAIRNTDIYDCNPYKDVYFKVLCQSPSALRRYRSPYSAS